MERNKIFDDLIDENDNVVLENWIEPKDIVEYVEQQLTSVGKQEFTYVDKIMEQLESIGIPIVELYDFDNKNIEVEVGSLSEYIKYLEAIKPRVLFVYDDFVIHCYDGYKSEPFSLDFEVEREFKNSGILSQINKIAENFLENNDLMSDGIRVFDENRVGLSYRTEGNLIEILGHQLNALGEKLLQQKEIIKEKPMLFS